MADERRGPRTGRTRSGPGAGARPRRPARQAAAPVPAARRPRSRLTGRAAILVLVLAVLAVSYASSLRAYLQQRSSIEDLESQIAERQRSIDELEDEKERWQDPAYVAQQARERFGYVAPGETPFVVIDENGEPLTDAELDEPDDGDVSDRRTWYDDLWDSVTVAGDPPTTIPPPPAKRIDGSEEE